MRTVALVRISRVRYSTSVRAYESNFTLPQASLARKKHSVWKKTKLSNFGMALKHMETHRVQSYGDLLLTFAFLLAFPRKKFVTVSNLRELNILSGV
jgi:hypothetical protein